MDSNLDHIFGDAGAAELDWSDSDSTPPAAPANGFIFGEPVPQNVDPWLKPPTNITTHEIQTVVVDPRPITADTTSEIDEAWVNDHILGGAGVVQFKQRKGLKFWSLLLGVIAVVGAAVAAVVIFVLPLVLGPAFEDEKLPKATAITVEATPTGVPGYTSTAAWDLTIPTGASLGGTHMGLAVVEKDKFRVLSLKDGKPVLESTLTAPVGFTATTVVDGHEVLFWKTGGKLFWWGGSGDPTSVDLPEGAEVSMAGDLPLIASGDKKWTLRSGKLVECSEPSDIVAADSTYAVALVGDSGLKLLPADGTATKSVALTPPVKGATAIRWVAVGRGQAVVVWSTVPNPQSSTPVVIATHTIASGVPTSQQSVRWGEVQSAKWTRTMGGLYGTVGTVAVDIVGNKVKWQCSNCTLVGGYHDLIQFGSGLGSGLLLNGKSSLTSGDIVAANEDAIVLKDASGVLHGFARSK